VRNCDGETGGDCRTLAGPERHILGGDDVEPCGMLGSISGEGKAFTVRKPLQSDLDHPDS
jgi:hypothetical protein